MDSKKAPKGLYVFGAFFPKGAALGLLEEALCYRRIKPIVLPASLSNQ